MGKTIALFCAFVLVASPAAAQTMPGGGGGGGGGSGITQLTGDVTAGPGTGSQAASVVQVNGATPGNTCPGGQFVNAINTSAQGSCATPTSSGNVTISPTSGNVTNDILGMSNTTTGVKDLGVGLPATNIYSSSQSLTAAQFNNGNSVLCASACTLTFPASSTLGANGILYTNAYGGAITLQANAADEICYNGSCGSAGGTLVTSQGTGTIVSTDTSGHLYVQQIGVGTGNANFGTATGNTSGHVVTLANTTTGVQDSGTALTALAPLASPTFTGTVTVPVTGSTQCLQANTSGAVSGTGSACGGSGSQAPVTYLAGNYYYGANTAITTGNAVGNGTIHWYPVTIYASTTIKNLCARITTVGTTNLQFAIYANSSSNTPTGSALASTSSVVNTSLGIICGTVNYAISPGQYWFGENANDGTVVLQAPAVTNTTFGWSMGATSTANLSAASGQAGTVLSTTQTFGTWPSNPTVAESSSGNSYFMPIFGL